ncbi:MAG: aspartate dehydrogenase [Candidatus Omnitrophota bacterium]
MLKIGIIGCGTIGSSLAKAISRDLKDRAKVAAICDPDTSKTEALVKTLPGKPPVLGIDELIEESELVIEAASAGLSLDIAKRALSAKRDVMIMSVGGIIKDFDEISGLAARVNRRVYLPSGAICGIDGVKSASVGAIKKAALTTRKPPKGLCGAPFILKNNIDLSAIKDETVIFEGNALEAMEGFPANINVASVLSLSGIGPENTRVKIMTSPAYTKNSHEVALEGEFGSLFTRTENVPSPTNPKTSFLAVLSAIATLRGILNPVKIGT